MFIFNIKVLDIGLLPPRRGLNQDRSLCFVVRKTTSELERAIFTTMFLLVQKTLTVSTPGRGICNVLFLDTFRWFPDL
jgi:hypothetical protein